MQVNETNLYELTRKAKDLTSDTEEITRLLKARLGPDHELVRSAIDMHGSLEMLAHELRCTSIDNLDSSNEIDVSEKDT